MNAGMVGEISHVYSGFDFCYNVVAGKIGAKDRVFQVGDTIRTNLSHAFRVKGPPVRKKEWLMSLRSWLFGDHTKADQAIKMADEVAQLARDKGEIRDPIRSLLSELIFRKHDIALVADAYEISQESRIYRGPPEARSQ